MFDVGREMKIIGKVEHSVKTGIRTLDHSNQAVEENVLSARQTECVSTGEREDFLLELLEEG